MKNELKVLRQDMDNMQSWLEEVISWSESADAILGGMNPQSPRDTCHEPGCTCQYEDGIETAAQQMETDGQ